MKTFHINTADRSITIHRNGDRELVRTIKGIDGYYETEAGHSVKLSHSNKGVVLNLVDVYDMTRLDDVAEPERIRARTDTKLAKAIKKGNFLYEPRSYQIDVLKYGLEKGSYINGEVVGAGKSFSAILHTEIGKFKKVLIVCPASIKAAWAEKYVKITKGRVRPEVITTATKKNDWTKKVTIINYDIIGKKQGKGAVLKFPQLKSKKWDLIIFDEAHFLKSSKAIRSKAARILSKTGAEIIMLTGTPVANRTVEIWNLLMILGKSKTIANDWMHFVRRYCGAYRSRFGWVTDGSAHTKELNEKLRASCYIRHDQNEVNSELQNLPKRLCKWV